MDDTQSAAAVLRRDPVLSLLCHKVERAFGVRITAEQALRLKGYLEAHYGYHPGTFEEALEDPGGRAGLIPLITVNETYFFRESVQFRLLSRRLLPLLAGRGGPLRICSAAGSSGCEAYSIAMLVDFYCRGRDLGQGGPPLSWELDAFDLNPEMIECARKGRYTANTLREDGLEWKSIMDLYLSADSRGFEVAGILRDKVRFFTHNLLDPLNAAYDLIFFRNALIYFPPENRRKVLDNLIQALVPGGNLFVGVSETSSVEEERLELVHHQGVFYFTKRKAPAIAAKPAAPPLPEARIELQDPRPPEARVAEPAAGPGAEAVAGIARILNQEEGRPNAGRVLDLLRSGDRPGAGELAAAALTLLGAGDFSAAGLILSRLEEGAPSPVTSFLRGEWYYHRGGEIPKAEAKYQEAAAGEAAFWPAYYRICSLAEEGNRTRYAYRLKKALESMERGAGLGYEIFIGGFSPDYYRRILERKVAEEPGG
ncbi:MAG: hypothetical protein LBU21_02250 [Treponema sp.]|jgi:chemotaxis protein methyltransferase CheR|nr:hypothetical protein [Treponema sp.]